MSFTLAAAFAAQAAEGEHVVNELPMPPIAFGVTALVIFAVLLLVTFSFRSVGTRHD